MGIRQAIEGHRRIMFDTAPIVYFIEEHKEFGKIADEIFKVLQGEVDNFFRLNGDMFKSKEFQDAWYQDMKQSPLMRWAEIEMAIQEIEHALKNLKSWMEANSVKKT